MRRRDFIAVVGGAVVAAPFTVRAQTTPTIGFLHSADAQSFSGPLEAFRRGLSEGGFTEGRNVTVEYRWAEGRVERLPELAADLARRRVIAIVATGGNASNLAAKKATTTIPVVFASGSDPVRLGLVTSLSRPEANVTGVTFFVSDLVAKALDLLHQLIPAAKSVTVLVNPRSPEGARQPNDAHEAARKLRIELAVAEASTDPELDRAFASQPRPDALLVGGDPFFGSRVERLVGLAARHRIPTMFYRREFVSAGGLVSYGTSITDAYRQVGIYTAKILKGAKPADLPVLQSLKFDFAINLKTAKALGLEFHPQLLATADEVIE
jgi:putative tryptophan/tyrosine transport system substrate-binding protein